MLKAGCSTNVSWSFGMAHNEKALLSVADLKAQKMNIAQKIIEAL